MESKTNFLLFIFQDVEMDSQSQSSFERTLSERGQSQMSTASDEAWRGRPHARKQPTHLSPVPFWSSLPVLFDVIELYAFFFLLICIKHTWGVSKCWSHFCYLNFVSSVLDFVIVCPPLYVNYTLEKDTMTHKHSKQAMFSSAKMSLWCDHTIK